MDVSPLLVVGVAATFLFAGLVKGVIGLGLPAIAIGILAIAMPPAQAAALLIVPSLASNVWQMFAGPYLKPLLRRLWPLLAASIVGVFLGGGLLTSPNSRWAALGLGLALVLYGGVGLSGLRFSVSPAAERWLTVPIGLATGLIAGGTGVFVIPAGPYFQALGMEKEELVQMLGLSFTLSTVALAYVLWRDGVLVGGTSLASFAAVAPALAGVALGQLVRRRVSERVFRLCFFSGLVLLGAQQAVRNLL